MKTIGLILLGILGVIALTESLSASYYCLSLSPKKDASICYTTELYTKKSDVIKNQFRDLVKRVKKPDDDLSGLVFFTQGFQDGAGSDVANKVKKAYDWVEDESLRHIIEGEKVSAVLLSRTKTDRYVLFYDMTREQFFFSYDDEMKYFPVILEWVNNRYPEESYIEKESLWKALRGSECVFERDGVVLKGNKSSQNLGECDFGFYSVLKTKEKTKIIINSEKSHLPHYYDQDKMFLRWILN